MKGLSGSYDTTMWQFVTSVKNVARMDIQVGLFVPLMVQEKTILAIEIDPILKPRMLPEIRT
jgi:hypothetical protein